LSVVEQTKKGKGTGVFEVIAGGRRLAALQVLATKKQIGADADIDCVVFESKDAVSVSIAENDPEPMHPADQCAGYAKLVADGLDSKQIATRFGVTAAFVERRLRLANVAPEIVAQFREGKASLEQMQALAVTTDHTAQLGVWKATAKRQYDRDPERLREALIEDRVAGDDAMVKLVGIDAYLKAGGAVESDLFGAAGSVFLLDRKLIRQLANDAMQQAARKVVGKRRCNWIDVDMDPRHYRTTHDRVDTIPSPLTTEQAAQRAAIQKQINEAEAEADAIEQRWQDLPEGSDTEEDALTEEQDAITDRIEKLTEQRDAIRNGQDTIPEDVLPLIGAVARLDASGKVTTSYPMTRLDDRKAVEAIKRKATKERETTEKAQLTAAGVAVEPAETDGPMHSDVLARCLTSAKTLALRAAFATQTNTTIRMLAHALVAQTFAAQAHTFRGPSMAIRTERVFMPDDASEATPAACREIARIGEYWHGVIPAGDAERTQWFLQADFQQVLDVLAYVAALQVNVVQNAEKTNAHYVSPSTSIDPYAKAIQYDAHAWFQPTAANYFGRVNKGLMLAGLTDAGIGAEDLAKVGKAKKSEAAAMAEQLVASGSWVPPLVRAA